MKYIMLGACVVLSAAAYAAESAASFVFVNPDTSSFWRTARSQSVTVPVDFPEEATTATLSVAGVGYSASYEIAAPGPYTFQLPEAATLAEENTYSLVLAFDRGEGKTARLSVITGLEVGAAGSTRCVSQSSRSWPMRRWHCQNGRTRYSCHSPSPIHSKLTDCVCNGPLPGSIQKISPMPERFPFARNTTSCAAEEARSNDPL